MTEQEFRRKYPHSTEEQVQLYGEAVKAEALAVKPPIEPDILMPIVTVPERVAPTMTQVPASEVPETTATTYSVARGDQYFMRNFSLDDVPPEMPSLATDSAMREVMLGPFAAHLSPEQRLRFQTTDMSADEMLAAFFDPKWTPGGLASH